MSEAGCWGGRSRYPLLGRGPPLAMRRLKFCIIFVLDPTDLHNYWATSLCKSSMPLAMLLHLEKDVIH